MQTAESKTTAWSRKHERCLKCKTQEYPHKSKGLCSRCYNYETEDKQKSHINRRSRKLDKGISIDELKFLYELQQMSLNDIAHKYNCTRQYIHKLMKKYYIERRDKSKARELALNSKKIAFDHEDESGKTIRVIHQRNIFNRDFFKSWSSAMAYVLGVLYTDGCMYLQSYNTKSPSGIKVFQKQPELLYKISKLMESNAKLYFRIKKGISGAGYSLQLNDNDVCADLLKWGLFPNKSHTLIFPDIEPQYVRHFIRGCWDGDGSVYLEGNNPNKPCASFVSGSRPFIEELIKHLATLGLPNRTIHTDKRRAFYFRYTGLDCSTLYHVLYDGVTEGMYLSRKCERFKAIADYFEEHEQLKLNF